jgi:hypothetical protein
MVKLLQFPLEGSIDVIHLTKVFKTAYIVLYTYMIGESRKNALYFAKYIDFFNTQIKVTIVSNDHVEEFTRHAYNVILLAIWNTCVKKILNTFSSFEKVDYYSNYKIYLGIYIQNTVVS